VVSPLARKKSSTLTEAELRIMDVLWEKGRASVKDVTEALATGEQPLAYNTVLTMLRILHQKKYANYLKEGRAFIYEPLVGKEQARQNVVSYLLNRFFDNSPSLLVQNLLDSEAVDASELEQLKQRIEDHGEVGQ